jgi:hypothetical protein
LRFAKAESSGIYCFVGSVLPDSELEAAGFSEDSFGAANDQQFSTALSARNRTEWFNQFHSAEELPGFLAEWDGVQMHRNEGALLGSQRSAGGERTALPQGSEQRQGRFRKRIVVGVSMFQKSVGAPDDLWLPGGGIR